MVHHVPTSSLPFVALFISFLLICCTPKPTRGGNRGNDEEAGRHAGTAPRLQTYIVRVHQPESATFAGREERDRWYRSFLSVEAAAEDIAGMGERRWVYSYHETFTGFAARLTEEEVTVMKKKDGFLHAYPDSVVHPSTTHSPEFLGLHMGSGLWDGGHLGEGVIVGMIDGGITPGHPSFNDEGMPPPPSRWKGSCKPLKFCNNKIIGAKAFINGSDPETVTPADEDGHGTHTASIAAGSFVKGANVVGSANGTASGVAPRAHLAIYKVCTAITCVLSDVLAAIDTAVADGVDVLSISLNGRPLSFIHNDVMAIAAFGATKRGVFVSCSAGNDASADTVSNDAPWELTVGASTIDRSFVANVKLGDEDGSLFYGESLFQPAGFTRKLLPLVFPQARIPDDSPVFTCKPQYLAAAAAIDLEGKIVFCHIVGDISPQDQGVAVFKAGAAGMILMGAEFSDTVMPEAHVLPVSHITYPAGQKIKDYVRNSSHPTASIHFEGTVIGVTAPTLATFSSRGPSGLSPGIIKPDVIGPGVNILAAWPSPPVPSASRSPSTGDHYFNIKSGTSMAAPHLSGIAALLKNAHPDWSPAAIRSAIMTTASIRRNDGNLMGDSVFGVGAGHVNASRTADPGLVFDLSTNDYVGYICGLGYTDEQVTTIVGERVNCSAVGHISRLQLNYPSISLQLTEKSPTVDVSRTVVNVGEANETYKVEVKLQVGYGQSNVTVSVIPQTLTFSAVKEKQRFTVTFSKPDNTSTLPEGSLQLVSAKHVVRIPIAIEVNP